MVLSSDIVGADLRTASLALSVLRVLLSVEFEDFKEAIVASMLASSSGDAASTGS